MTRLEDLQSRINFYQFLSFLFNREITSEFYSELQESEIAQLMVERGYLPSYKPGPDELKDFIEELQCEFTRIFIGPGKHLPPYESVHLETGDDANLLWGKTTAEVNRFYKYYGFDFTPDYGGIPDHISVEFEFMWKILKEEIIALEGGDSSKAVHCRKVQREFFNKHVKTWVPGFCHKVLTSADSQFYHGIASLTRDFIDEEDRVLNSEMQ